MSVQHLILINTDNFYQAIVERRVIRVSPNTWEMLIYNMIEIQQRQVETDQRLAQLEQKQTESEQRLAGVEQKQAATEQKLAKMEKRFNTEIQ